MNILETARRWIWAIVALLAVIALISAGLAWNARKQTRAANDAATQAQGRTTSAVEAIDKITDLGERTDATQTEVSQAQEAIRNAAPEDRDLVFRYNACLLQHRTDCDRLL